jgi:valyl-tRNA synthetase
MLDKTYRPDAVEQEIYARWEDAGAFACGKSDGAPYTIVIPPPNVTGSLHMGHALNNTVQDILIRFERMRGRDALWQPGMDHAGIATQMVVERQLAEQDITRHDLGRDAFIERVWTWKAESGGTIIDQLRRLGASCDWARERFTMDDGLSLAVRKVFVDLHKQGLIYRDKRLVNWDPKLHTAISDLEVEARETVGKLWYFKYPVEGEEGTFLTVATTRPETMLGDTGVAVHPEDERYTHLIGKTCILPLVGRRMPIIADDYADPEKGSGAVKMTPAHDFNDFEVGRRHDLEMVNVLDQDARLNDAVPEAYQGLDRFEARDRIIADMDAQGLLEKVEDNPMTVPYGDRSGVIVEPWLTDQWFVDAATLAKPAIEAVEKGETNFVPANWANTYYEWMRNIQPWCISRQIWWGHQVPAWYGPDETIFVEMTEEAAQAAADKHYGEAVELRRDSDVLDTWFSSALWPFSTLGWPEETPEMDRYYPTDVLVTGFDIIFFWVARMMMMGLHFLGKAPFHTVYIHALVRDAEGQKMSKSKGNVLDPIELTEKFGTDAVRFTLAALAVQGRDIRLAESRIEGYRNFVTKLWNAARFTQMNGCEADPNFDPAACTQTVNRWIVGKAAEATIAATGGLEAYKFNEAAGALYHFTWGTFCDWYLEFTKPIFDSGDAAAIAETRATTAWVLWRILHLLHPMMPFVTEELWAQTGGDGLLITADWPRGDDVATDAAAAAEMDWVVDLITEIRSIRAQFNVEPGKKIAIGLQGADEVVRTRLAAHADLIQRLARLSELDGDVGEGTPKGAVQGVVDQVTVYVFVADAVDLVAETARLEKEIAKLAGEIAKFDKKLANKGFLDKAPADVIEEQRQRRDRAAQDHATRTQALERLSAL